MKPARLVRVHAFAALLCCAACTTTTPVIPEGIDNPRSVAAPCFRKLTKEPVSAYKMVEPKRCTSHVCLRKTGEGADAPRIEVDLAECATASGDELLPSNATVRVLVGGGSKGSISLADPGIPAWVDTDTSIPGWTPFALPGLPGPMVVDAAQGRVYVTLPLEHQILSLDATLLLQGKLKPLAVAKLDFEPSAMVLAQSPEPRLYLADSLGDSTSQSGGRLWQLAVSGFASTAPTAIAVGGTPNSLTVAAATGHIYIGHLREGHITVYDPVSSSIVQRIAIAPACDDGLDNDGDGLVDRADSGCDGPHDAIEGDPEFGPTRCADGVDNDGDGQTDAADLGCSATNTTADACRNGKDDDGDGHADFPADRGCAGWGDASENSDNLGLDPGLAHSQCEDGVDNDGDGHTDLEDAQCYNRASLHEVASFDESRALVAATFDGHYVVAADRDRRILFVIDTHTRALVVPQLGSNTPFQHPSRLDQRDGIHGLPMSQQPMSLAPVRYLGRDAIAVGQTLSGVVLLQFELSAEGLPQVGLLLDPTKTDAQRLTTSSGPSLVIEGRPVDLGASISARYASLGRLAVDTDSSQTPARTSYYGLTPNPDVADHRSEVWRFEFEGVLPGGERRGAILLDAGVLHDPGADFCAMGALPGDLVLIHRDSAPACAGLATGATAQFRIAAVHGDRLELSPDGGHVDVVVTAANILNIDPKAAPALALLPPTCFDASGVHYTVRARDWLVTGTRTGVLSSRPALDGECTTLADWERAGSRLIEPVAASAGEVKLSHCPPYTPPSSDGSLPIQIDPALLPSPMTHPVFSAQIYPGCADKRVLPSIRGAVWSFALAAGLQARSSGVGAAPIAMVSGPTLSSLYVVSQAAGALYSVLIADDTVASPLQ